MICQRTKWNTTGIKIGVKKLKGINFQGEGQGLYFHAVS